LAIAGFGDLQAMLCWIGHTCYAQINLSPRIRRYQGLWGTAYES